MRKLASITLVMFMTLNFAGNSFARKDITEPKQLTAEALLPIVKEIISKLAENAKSENSESFRTPVLTNAQLSQQGNTVKLSGQLEVGPVEFGKVDVILKNTGTHIQANGKFADFSGDNPFTSLPSSGICKANISGRSFQLNFDIKKQVFTGGTYELADFNMECKERKLSIQGLSIKSTLLPASQAEQYLTKTTFSIDNLLMQEPQSNRNPWGVKRKLEKLAFTLSAGPINISKRATLIDMPYHKFWPSKTPSISIITDLFFLKNQESMEKFLGTMENLKTLRFDFTSEKYIDETNWVSSTSKKLELILDVLGIQLKTKADDQISLRLPKANLSVNYSSNGMIEIKAKERLNAKIIADFIRSNKSRTPTPADFFLLLPQPLNIDIKSASKSKNAEFKADGSISLIGVVPNISLTLYAENLVDDFKAMFTMTDETPSDVKACITTMENTLKGLKPLAMKNKESTDKKWYFHFQGLPVPGTFLVNQTNPQSLDMPEVAKIWDNCANMLEYIPVP